jgi:hypothetical protein
VTVHQTIVDDGPGGIIVGKAAPSAHLALLLVDAAFVRGPNPLAGLEPSAAMSQSASF